VSKSKTLYPVAGYYLAGVPHVEHECDGEGLHHICAISGAFTETPPDEGEPTEDPADAGSLDLEES
jgi:hypothetical protein